MADFTALKTAIQTYIKQNGNEEITGEKLQEILLSMVTTLGDSAINDLVTALNDEVAARQNADGTLQQNITNEATARGNADTALGGRIDDEATARANGDTALSNRLGSSITAENTAADQIGAEAEARAAADTALQGLIDGITDNINNGYVYAGIATPSSTPATGKVFYLALTAGTYTNFGNTEVSQGINILKYNGSAWSLDAFIGIDDELTPSSNNLPKSGNVLENIIKNGSAFDLSAYNAVGGVLATYADLDAALTALNALPAVYKQGGMSFRFVRTSDNKYRQFKLKTQTFSTKPNDWYCEQEEIKQLNQKVGEFDYDYTKEVTGYINANGSVTSSSAFGITNDIQLYAGDTIRAKTGSQGFAIIAKHSSGTNPYEQIKAAVINQWVEYTATEDTIVVCCGLVNNANPSLDLAIKIKRVQSIENQIELLNNDVNLRLKTENSVSLAIQGKGNDNSTYLSLKLIEGQKYSLVFDKTTWNTTSITGNNVVFALDRISDGASSNVFVVRGSSPTVKKEYIFVADTNDYYKFLVKSDIGETVFFSVINITDAERTNNVFEGNNISFVGDSITTFNGYNGSNPYYYPTGDVLSVEDTWWRKMLRKTNGNLKENLSASGGSVCRISQRTSLIDNVSLLQNTDVLLLAGGVNDSIVGATLGYCDFTKSTSDLDETKFSEAYDKYVRIAQTKANKVLIIITSKIGNDYRDIIIKIAEHYGIQYIDLTKISSIIGTISNSVHPNKSGMEFMSDYVTDELYSNFSPIREIVEVLKNNLFLIEWNNGTLNSTTGAIEPVASAAYSNVFSKGTKLRITLKRGYAYGIYRYQEDGVTFVSRDYYYNVGYDRVIYYTVTDGTARILFDGLGTTVDTRTIGNYIKVEVLSDYVLPEKLNANTILNRRTVVSDAFSYLCGDASFLLADGNTGIAYVGYSTSKTGYGEQKSIIALSVFPLCQPFRAEHYEVMKVGETYGSYTFSNFRDINFIQVGNIIRCFFSGYIGESLDVTWYYMDFDKTTHNVSNPQVVKFKKPGNATLFDLSKTNWQAFLTEGSVEFNSDSSPAPNANFVYHDNKLYTVICTLSDIGKCCGHNAVAYTTDNGETFQVTGIVPYGCEYEAQMAFDEDGKMYMVQRGNAGSDMNYKPLVTSDDNGQTFSGMNFFTIGSTRPQMLNYKGNILLCTPLENWMDSEYAKDDWRAGFVMRIGTGTETKDYKEVLRLYSKEGLLYYSIMNYKGVLYAAIIEGGLFPDKSGNRKDKVSFCRIGEIDAFGNLILD